MSEGAYTINGRDAWSDYGLRIERGGTSGLLALPGSKARVAHDWEDEDGEEVLLTPTFTKSRSITISCLLTASDKNDFWQKYNGLYAELAKGITQLYVREYSELYDLLLTGFGKPKKLTRIAAGKVMVSFSIDFKETTPSAGVVAMVDMAGYTPADENDFYLSE